MRYGYIKGREGEGGNYRRIDAQ
jgi:hypothetical protein